MNAERKHRWLTLSKKGAIIIGIGVAYLLLAKWSGLGIPCPFYTFFHIYCPGCGVSRMLVSLLTLDFSAAMQYNLLAFCLLPLFAAAAARRAWIYIKTGKVTLDRVDLIGLTLVTILALLFGILRNFEAFSFLAP